MSIKTLQPPEFTDDEQAQLVTDLLALKKSQIGEFLARVNLPRTGTKEQIRGRIEKALHEKTISFSLLIQFLDEVIPWGKQHVFLFKGPRSSIANWKNQNWLANLLKQHRFGRYLNASLALASFQTR